MTLPGDLERVLAEKLREELRKTYPQPQPLRIIPVYKYQGGYAIGQLDYNPDTDRLLVSGYDSNKLFEVDMKGNKTWEMILDTPNTAYYLGDGTILVLEQGYVRSGVVGLGAPPRLLQIDMATKQILWSLNLPMNSDCQAAYPLPNPLEWNGNILLTYRSFPGRNPRIVEIDKNGDEVWVYEPTSPTLYVPSFAFRAPGYYAVVPDFRHRVQIVDPDLSIAAQYGVTDRRGVGHNRLCNPEAVAADIRGKSASARIFIADWGNDRIVVWYPRTGKFAYLPFIVQRVSGMVYNGVRNTLFACSNLELTIYELPVIEVEKPPFLATVSDKLWDNESISAGAVSVPCICKGYRRKTVYFLTSTSGDITIEVDPDGSGSWMTLYSETDIGVRDTSNPWKFSTDYDFWQLRVKFSAAATVTCWVSLGD